MKTKVGNFWKGAGRITGASTRRRYYNLTNPDGNRSVAFYMDNRANQGLPGLPPPSPGFKASNIVGDWMGKLVTYPTEFLMEGINQPWARITSGDQKQFNAAAGWLGDLQMNAQAFLGLDILKDCLGITGPLAIASLDAVAYGSYTLGMPHAHHLHPPSLTPAGIIPLPSFGLFTIGGSYQTLINKRRAMRAGDIGFSTCAGIPPLFAIYTGSSSVFVGGARAARTCDIVNHCHWTEPKTTPNSKLQNRMLMAGQWINRVMASIWLIGTTSVAIGAVKDGVEAVKASQREDKTSKAMSKALAVASLAAAAQVRSDLIAAAMSNMIGRDPCQPLKNFGMAIGPGSTVKIGGYPMPPWEAVFGFFFKRLGRVGRAYGDLKGRSLPAKKGGGKSNSAGTKAKNNKKQQTKNNNTNNKNNNNGPNNNKNTNGNNGKRTTKGPRFRARFRKARMDFRKFSNRVRRSVNKAYKSVVSAGKKVWKATVRITKRVVRGTRKVVAKTAKMTKKAARYAAKQTKKAANWTAKTSKKIYTKVTSTFSRTKNGNANPKKGGHKTKGCPISLITGEELLSLEDFTLRGSLSLTFERTYRTGHDDNVGMGCGWTFTGCQRLETNDDTWLLHHSDGRQIAFCPIEIGEAAFNTREKATLTYLDHGLMRLEIDGDKWIMEPFAQGWLVTHLVDAFENFYHFERDDHGRWSGCHGDHGRGFRVDWNDQGFIAGFIPSGSWYHHAEREETEPYQAIPFARYSYDDEGNLTAAFDRINACERYDYRNHVLIRRTLKTGFNFYFEWDRYDIHARCQSTWGDHGNYRYQFQWYLDERLVAVTNVLGHQELVAWDEAGNIISERDGNGNTTAYRYDKIGNLVMVIDALDRKTEYLYDDMGRLVQVIDPMGGSTLPAYRHDGLPDFIQDRAGNAWLTEYNARGAEVATWDPHNSVTFYENDRRGNRTRTTYADGTQEVRHWNSAGDNVMIVHTNGGITRQKFDHDGNLIEQRQPDGEVLRFENDAMGRPTRVLFPDGTSELFFWTAANDIWKHCDRGGRVTRYDYAGLRQPQSQTNPDGTVIRYHYDNERNLIRLDNEEGESMTFAYDGAENLVERVGFDGRRHCFQYDAANRLLVREEPGQTLLNYEYDALDNLITVCAEDPRDGSKTNSRYEYDHAGNLISALNKERHLSFRYDALGNLIEEWQDDEPLFFHYDAVGNLIGKELPNGKRVNIKRDHSGDWTAVHLEDHCLASVTRDRLGRERERHFGNGLIGLTEYDAAGRINQQRVHKQPLRWDLLNERRFDYDHVGNLVTREDAKRGTTRFCYDRSDFPVRVMQPPALGGDLVLAHDRAGNIIGDSRGNRLQQFKDQAYAYDARGNLIERRRGATQTETTTFEYNALDQMIACTHEGRRTTYAYDALGRRIRKTTDDEETVFYWDRLSLLMEEQDDTQRWFFHEPESCIPLTAIRDDETFYFHVDQVGTPWEVSDARGRVQWSASYDTWGGTHAVECGRFDNPFRLQGQYFDQESGLHYNLNRYYDPENGRFCSQDPIGLAGGLNAYLYAPNTNRWVDPLGFCKESMQQKYEAYKDRKGTKAMDFESWYQRTKNVTEGRARHKYWKDFFKNEGKMPDHAKFTTAKMVKLTPEMKQFIDRTGPMLAKKAGATRPQIWVYGGQVDQKVWDYAKGKVDIFVF